ncbi:MAG: FHA domain-containing protein [Candidatus Dadabacteria bacterium]|nr:MAG: FHA domain-containing protein [Candidatus Dadabacteria bacterium]
MGNSLKIEEYAPDGSRKDLGIWNPGYYEVGREPRAGIKVDRNAVSRVHGALFEQGGYWFYKDLGSTNGSWVNNSKIEKGDLALVRYGDKIQLADTFLAISSPHGANVSSYGRQGIYLLVLENDMLARKIEVRNEGVVLTGGGPDCDIPLEGHIASIPRFAIEYNNGFLTIKILGVSPGESSSLEVKLDGEVVSGLFNLKDRSRIAISRYRILVDHPIVEAEQPFSPKTELHQAASSLIGDSFRETTQISSSDLFSESQWAKTSPSNVSKRPTLTRQTFGNLERPALEELESVEKEAADIPEHIPVEGSIIASRRYSSALPQRERLIKSRLDLVVVVIGFLTMIAAVIAALTYVLLKII